SSPSPPDSPPDSRARFTRSRHAARARRARRHEARRGEAKGTLSVPPPPSRMAAPAPAPVSPLRRRVEAYVAAVQCAKPYGIGAAVRHYEAYIVADGGSARGPVEGGTGAATAAGGDGGVLRVRLSLPYVERAITC